MKRCILLLALLFAPVCVSAQSLLTITDALPPYDLSAWLLNNGHFAIGTSYTGQPKPLIYREDGTGNRPVNYTSHLHIKVDGVVYKMGYEVDETTGQPPPNQIVVRRLYRDTVSGRPRINADMQILHGPGDTVNVVFTMEPVRRSTGGFIRMSVVAENRGRSTHNIGVLLLIDTKIGDNDRSPIATSFGYRTVETEYDASIPPGIPDYWLALEGSPVGPGLTARGNLIESELIRPDLVIIGNWVDDPSRGTIGLRLNEWDERRATGFDYSDSGVLLIWNPAPVSVGQRVLRAATELGIVDSLRVSQGGGGGGGGGGGIVVAGPGGGNGCIIADTVRETTCGDPTWHPYTPDTVQPLFLVTNVEGRTLTNVSVDVVGTEPGVDIVSASTPVIPSTLADDQTGVGSVTLALRPRLQPATYAIPIAVRADGLTPSYVDTLCISVPGLQATIDAVDVSTPPICPSITDTIALRVNVNGVRCLPLVEFTVLDVTTATVSLLAPLPVTLSSAGQTLLPLAVTPTVEGSVPVRIRLRVREYESLVDGDTTWVEHIDTVTVTVVGKHAEYTILGTTDTLDLGDICVNDTLRGETILQNIGGCALDITALTWIDDVGGRFAMGQGSTTPITIERGDNRRVRITFVSPTPGVFVGTLDVVSVARPGARRIAVKASVVTPQLSVADTIDLDTICPDVDVAEILSVSTPVECPVLVDTIEFSGNSVTSTSTSSFVVPGRSRVSVPLRIRRTVDGPFSESIIVRSVAAGDRTVVVRGVVGSTRLTAPPQVDLGDVRVGTSSTSQITITANGSAPVTIVGFQLSGPSSTEYVVTAVGRTLPFTISSGATVDLNIVGSPTDIERRSALLTIRVARPLCEPLPDIDLTMRGIRPLLSADRPSIEPGRLCVGGTKDTTLTLRNRGNAPLTVTALTSSSPEVTVTATLPYRLEPDDTMAVSVAITPSQLGRAVSTITVTHDGEWAVAADSTITAVCHGVVCGTIAADTIVATVGERRSYTIRWIPRSDAPLSINDVVRLVDGGGRPTELALRHDGLVFRPSGTLGGSINDGTATVVFANDTTSLRSDRLVTSNVFAEVEIDVLRGGPDRTVVQPVVRDFAGGDADVNVLPGLVRSVMCAFDERGVVVGGQAILGRDPTTGDVLAIGVDTSTTVDVFTIDGRLLRRLNSLSPDNGVLRLRISDLDVRSGSYVVVLHHHGQTQSIVITQGQ